VFVPAPGAYAAGVAVMATAGGDGVIRHPRIHLGAGALTN